jgi:hypothetical protein
MLNHLSNLREIWLESNNIISIDRNVFIGMNNLERVYLSKYLKSLIICKEIFKWKFINVVLS